MHILLTDVLACPHCGPEFGLILLAERLEQRRVLDGSLACANCRRRYRVEGGYAELRVPPRGEEVAGEAEPGSREEAFRLAALLDLSGQGGLALVLGMDARLAPALARLSEGVEVVVTDGSVRGWPEEPGVSRLSAGARLPFYGRAFRGVAVTRGAEVSLEEAARVVAPMGRLVVDVAGADWPGAVEALGFESLLWSEGVGVARRKYA